MINNADTFSQPHLIIFTKGADIFGHDCILNIFSQYPMDTESNVASHSLTAK